MHQITTPARLPLRRSGTPSLLLRVSPVRPLERVNAGLARAKANGVKLGRGNRKDDKRSADEERWGMSPEQLEREIKKLREDGMGVLKIGRTLGVRTSVVQRVVMESEAQWSGPCC